MARNGTGERATEIVAKRTETSAQDTVPQKRPCVSKERSQRLPLGVAVSDKVAHGARVRPGEVVQILLAARTCEAGSEPACSLSRVAHGSEEVPDCVYRLTLLGALSQAHWLPTVSHFCRTVLKSCHSARGGTGGGFLDAGTAASCVPRFSSSMPFICLLSNLPDSGELGPCTNVCDQGFHSSQVVSGLSLMVFVEHSACPRDLMLGQMTGTLS